MSTSTAEHDSYLVENWDTETLIDFLKEQNLKLEEKHYDILRKEEITGPSFLDMTKDDFKECGLKIGPATRGQDPQRKAEACVLLILQFEGGVSEI